MFIILDKMDKIGLDGVAQELEKEGFAKGSCGEISGAVPGDHPDAAGVRLVKETLSGYLDPAYADGLTTIMDSVDASQGRGFQNCLRSHAGAGNVLLYRADF